MANAAIMRGIHETACIRSHPEIFGFRKVAIMKKFYVYGDTDQKFIRRPRRLNQNIPLLMDLSGFKTQYNSASHSRRTQSYIFALYLVFFFQK